MKTNMTEMNTVKKWTAESFAAGKQADELPFSFTYAGKKSAELLPKWKFEVKKNTRTKELRWTDPATKLECRCEVTSFKDFPVVEWIVHFRNTGSTYTPVLEDIQALDCSLTVRKDSVSQLHYSNGSECSHDDFAPHVAALGKTPYAPHGGAGRESTPVRLASKRGRSSCGTLPFFNVDMTDRGVIGAIGWTGDWVANFWRAETEIRMRAGMKKTHLRLLPGEEIRTPRIMLLFWEEECLRGHNLLRSFLMAHHVPRPDGKPVQTPVSFATWGADYEKNHIAHGKWWKDHKLPLDYLWIDAGWYGDDKAKPGSNVFNSDWWRYTGYWTPNPGYYPGGLKPIGKALKKMGIGFLLWFEPERTRVDMPWTCQYPKWLLGPGPDGVNYLMNLGIPEARRMVTDHVSKLIKEGGIGCYRQDFNIEPQAIWDAADTPDRVGITEIHYITGLYAMWDDLLRRHPGLMIDNCAGGGTRIDLETISRSIPLWRSDFQCFPNFNVTMMQTQTQGLGKWVPLNTGCCDRQDTYAFRSVMGPGMVISNANENNIEKLFTADWLRKRLAELNQVRKYFIGDFYPLLSFTLSDEAWTLWQYDRPDLGEGMILALRRKDCPFAEMTACLRNLDPKSDYILTNMDSGRTEKISGEKLCQSGLKIVIDDQPGSQLLIYRKV